jgi:predicted Zn-dependent protease
MKTRWISLVCGLGLAAWLAAPNGARAADTIVPAGGRVDDAEARLTYARILSYRKETWNDSVAAYERLLRDYPRTPAALTELAELRVRQGDFAAAEARLKSALAAMPDEPAAGAALARLYLWTSRPAEALTMMSQVRAKRPLQPAERLVYAEALTRAGRLEEASTEFVVMLAENVKPSAELLAAAGDARLAGGNLPAAKELYERALAVDSAVGGARRGLALTLAWTGDPRSALPRLAELTKLQPDDGDLIHAYIRAVNDVQGAAVAIRIAREHAEAAPTNVPWRIEWAELEAERGHAVASRRLFAEAQTLAPGAALALRAGRAAISWGDFAAGETALRAALRANPWDDQSREDLAALLVSGGRTEEAEQMYERWLLDSPSAEPALLGMVRLRMKEKDFAAALNRCDALLTLKPDSPDALQLRAEILLALHRPAEAREIYPRLAAWPGRRVDAELSQGRAARELKDEAAAAQHFQAAVALAPDRPAARFAAAGLGLPQDDTFLRQLTGGADEEYRGPGAPMAAQPVPETAPRLVEWASLYAERGEFARAVRCLKAARIADPDYYPAWAQLAEYLAIDAQFDAALAEFAALCAAMPDNRQILIGEARALAWSRKYDESLAAYARLAALNPADPVPRREAARTAGWGKMRERGAALYATAWSGEPVDQQLAPQLKPVLEGAAGADITQRWRRWTEAPAGEDAPFAWAERFAAERFALRDALPENRRALLDRVYVEVLPAFRLQRSWWLEDRAKQFTWDRRHASAESTFQQLLVVEPGNEEALFDLSQAQAAQGRGQLERATLSRLLQLDPNHSLASHALQRRDIRSRPLGTVEARSWRERGRGDLSALRRTAVVGEGQLTFSDQFHLRVSGQWGRETSLARPGDYSFRGLGLDVDGGFENGWSGSAGLLRRSFDDARISNATSGAAQLWWQRNGVGAGAGFERREELTNEFALWQGTHSDNFWLGGNVALSRRLDADLRVTTTDYSDGNRGLSVVVRPAYTWTDHPRVFKTIFTLEYRDTDRPTIYQYTGTQLTNLIFPYWTPANYLHGALTLEWYVDQARELFVGSEERYYDLRLTVGTDSEQNAALAFEADWHREWVHRWIAHGGLFLNLSREWDAVGLRLRLARRF